MSSNVGLTTPRGSGTSGYVQRNLAHLKPRDKPYSTDLADLKAHRQRQPDREILEHERKRDVEVRVFELRDRLEDEGYTFLVQKLWNGNANVVGDRVDEDEIDLQTEALRKKLLKESDKGKGEGKKGLKMHDVHGLAEAKIKQDDKFRSALGIRKDYEEGGHWKRQEERREKIAKGEMGPPEKKGEGEKRDDRR